MCRILNICYCFLQAGVLEKIKTNIQILNVQMDKSLDHCQILEVFWHGFHQISQKCAPIEKKWGCSLNDLILITRFDWQMAQKKERRFKKLMICAVMS